MKYLLDSNVLIYSTRPELEYAACQAWLRRNDVAASALAQVEVLGFSAITPAEVRYFSAVLAALPVLPITDQVLLRATEVRRKFGLKTPDGIVAATALVHGLELVTADLGFDRVAGLAVINPLVLPDLG